MCRQLYRLHYVLNDPNKTLLNVMQFYQIYSSRFYFHIHNIVNLQKILTREYEKFSKDVLDTFFPYTGCAYCHGD